MICIYTVGRKIFQEHESFELRIVRCGLVVKNRGIVFMLLVLDFVMGDLFWNESVLNCAFYVLHANIIGFSKITLIPGPFHTASTYFDTMRITNVIGNELLGFLLNAIDISATFVKAYSHRVPATAIINCFSCTYTKIIYLKRSFWD